MPAETPVPDDEVVDETPEAEGDEELDEVEQPEGAEDEGGETPDEGDDEPDPTFTVKVRGEEFDVDIDELIAGYQRGSDYTQSKQELAAASRVFDALREDPQKAIEWLTRELLPNGPADDVGDLTPEERALADVQRELSELREEREVERVVGEMSAVRNEFGFDEDAEDALYNFAAANRMVSLRKAYLLMQAEAGVATKPATAKSRRDAALAAKRGKPADASGGSRARGTSAPKVIDKPTFKEALAEALREAGHEGESLSDLMAIR